MTNNKKNKNSYAQLFFDDGCNLCIKTVYFIETFVKPKDTKYCRLSTSSLPKELIEKALNEMLFKTQSGRFYWGYQTYCKLFSISTSNYKYGFRIISFLMSLPVIRIIGKYVYKFISSRRKTCSIDPESSCRL